ncbi:MAG: Gfo/Idh/MocA family oxidoreductase [Candidatus Latescibacterota bacterium]|nr:Gfo/Idh/MocA family oxidoreductase [Candidatus Latescibacterota bacterium]
MSVATAVIGAGGAGSKRAAAVSATERSHLVCVCDVDDSAAQLLAAEHSVPAVTDWREVVADTSVGAVVVSTTHDRLSEITVAALRAGKHVLCEKPLGRNPAEVAASVAVARASGCVLAAGYNHRFHPGVLGLLAARDQGELGELAFVRARYGHGGRPGYDREWRGDADKAGGGEMLDQGAHLIDLTLWILGEPASVVGHVETRVWEIAPLEDNAFVLLRTEAGQVASLHATWTQWRNLFSFELFGRDGYAVVNGLGGSYGTETLCIGLRNRKGGVPNERRESFGTPDGSWGAEWLDVLDRIEGATGLGASGEDGLRTAQWIYRVYASAREGRLIRRDE